MTFKEIEVIWLFGERFSRGDVAGGFVGESGMRLRPCERE